MGQQERKRQKRIRQNVIDRDGMICCYCNKELTLDTITLDHIIPDSQHGTFNSTNLTIACVTCNGNRGCAPFFDFCKKYNFSEEKLFKYKKMYYDNLQIKIINIAKENCLIEDKDIPIRLIKRACNLLKIDYIDTKWYELSEIDLYQEHDRKKIKYYFEQLIRVIEADNA